MKKAFPALGVLLLLLTMALFGCTRTVTVTVPPRVDLNAYPAIGVLGFTAQPAGELGEDATQKFLGNLQAAQPGVRLLELGSVEQVLAAVGHQELDFQAIRAIGRKYEVAAVLTGTVELSDIRPDIRLSPNLTAATAQAKVDGKMSSKLWETASGATVWTNSSWGSWQVAGITLSNGGATNVGYRHPKEKHDQILMALVRALNGEFWPTYEKRRIQD